MNDMSKLFLALSFATLVVAGCSPDYFQSDILDATISKIQSGSNSSQQSGVQSPPLLEKTLGDVVLRPAQFLDGRLEILVPADFAQLDQSTIAVKYPTAARPKTVLANASTSVSIAINHTDNLVAPRQLTQLRQQLEMAIRQSQPNATWSLSGMQSRHGRDWIQLEFQSEAVDTQIENIMVATSVDGRMLAISFNCTVAQSAQWLAIGKEIVNSCRVQGK